MIKAVQQFNVLDSNLLLECIADYCSRASYQTDTMNKCSPGKVLATLTELCQQSLNLDLAFRSGNFYKHSLPYLPHTDYRLDQDNELNIVIPLEYTGTLPHLIVFDQTWPNNSVTWCMHKDLIHFEINTGVKGAPAEYADVKHLTGNPVSAQLHSYIPHYPAQMLFGLSGSAYSFTPGSIIAFNNQQIHCTSAFTGEKLGISLRFKIL